MSGKLSQVSVSGHETANEYVKTYNTVSNLKPSKVASEISERITSERKSR